MAKLATFTFILIAIMAFSMMSAYRTTTIEDNGHEMQMEISSSFQNQCPNSVQGDSCDPYFQFLISNHIKKCCSFLNNVTKQCLCTVIQQIHDKAQQRAADEFGRKAIHDAAQSLHNDCKLSGKGCQIQGPKV
ncbi:putative bifunctional inhibitor/plant lipid transfer protein/seed storage helical [Helianthus annuus]|nr:putative bifunctional inhibitor/plant lipid transfer protein/seed storage helical [Helianthus annuus]